MRLFGLYLLCFSAIVGLAVSDENSSVVDPEHISAITKDPDGEVYCISAFVGDKI